MTDGRWSHLDEQGRIKMVDVSGKPKTVREAHATGWVKLSREVLDAIVSGEVAKGNVFEAARVAGIMGAKKTWELIPLCHQVALTDVEVEFSVRWDPPGISIRAVAKATDRTGVEMEALTAVSVAALTIYDMCKALDKTIAIDQIRLVYKAGGKSGLFSRVSEG